MIDTEMHQQFVHAILVGLAQMANGLRMIADGLENGTIHESAATEAMRELALTMTEMVAEASK